MWCYRCNWSVRIPNVFMYFYFLIFYNWNDYFKMKAIKLQVSEIILISEIILKRTQSNTITNTKLIENGKDALNRQFTNTTKHTTSSINRIINYQTHGSKLVKITIQKLYIAKQLNWIWSSQYQNKVFAKLIRHSNIILIFQCTVITSWY